VQKKYKEKENTKKTYKYIYRKLGLGGPYYVMKITRKYNLSQWLGGQIV